MNKPVRGIVQGPDFQPKHDMVLLDSPLPNRKWVTVLVRSEGKDDGWPMVGEFAEWMIEAMHQLAAEALTSVEREAYDEIAAAIAGLFEEDRS